MFKKNIKGTFGYLKRKRNRVIVVTILYFVISIAIILIGYFSTGTKRNLFTVVGVLGCLPACKSMVNMIMLLRAKGCSDEAHREISKEDVKEITMYDMYFTSYKHNFAVSNMVICKNAIIAFYEDSKFIEKEFIDHITTMLSNGGHKNITISTVNDIKKYSDMLSNVNASYDENNASSSDEIAVILYQISL